MTTSPPLTGYRRRILIEPGAGVVTAELEDDWHRMVVTLEHEGGIVTTVRADMKRWPWTACRGAIAVAESTFSGRPVASVGRGDLRTSNCTHLYDLGLFAAAHADETEAVAYDIGICDPVDGVATARIYRNGRKLLEWSLNRMALLSPPELAGQTLMSMGDWINALDRDLKEAGRILRWASILAQGRAMEIPAGLEATAYPPGACYNFQPDVARDSRRREGADCNFDTQGHEPMADRAGSFAFS